MPQEVTPVASASPRKRVYIDKAQPEVFAAFTAAAKTVKNAALTAGLDRLIIELVDLRVSQINGCAYCLDTHLQASQRAGETVQRMTLLPAWRDTTLFTERERAALAIAEVVTDLGDPQAQEAAYQFAAGIFDSAELAAVIWLAINMNAFNRVSILSRHPVRPAERQQ